MPSTDSATVSGSGGYVETNLRQNINAYQSVSGNDSLWTQHPRPITPEERKISTVNFYELSVSFSSHVLQFVDRWGNKHGSDWAAQIDAKITRIDISQKKIRVAAFMVCHLILLIEFFIRSWRTGDAGAIAAAQFEHMIAPANYTRIKEDDDKIFAS